VDDSFNEEVEVPQEKMQPNSADGDTFSWGFSKWGQLFSKRQLYTLEKKISILNVYNVAKVSH